MGTDHQRRLAQVAHDTAYVLLSRRAHNEAKELREEFEGSPDLVALSYFTHAAKLRGVTLNVEDVCSIRGHTGRIGDCDFGIVEYPPLPAIDLRAVFSTGTVPSRYILAPYFSAVVWDRSSSEVHYFVLGQSIDSQTTLRKVSPELNVNLGSGSEPTLKAFLRLLRGTLGR